MQIHEIMKYHVKKITPKISIHALLHITQWKRHVGLDVSDQSFLQTRVGDTIELNHVKVVF